MEIMRGIYTCTPFLIILMSGLSLGQSHVCLKYKDRGDTMDIICSVDRLKYQIKFTNPAGKESGNCGEPFRVGKGTVFCNEAFNINQDLTTNITTLIIKKNELIYGEWKCDHGTNIGSDSVDIKMPVSNPRWDIIMPLIIVAVGLIALVYVGGCYLVVRRKGKTECVPKCTSCSQNSIRAICIDCKQIFCERCCNTHNHSKPHHKVFKVDHVTGVNCKYCSNMATTACLHCVFVFCDDCTRGHLENNHNVKILRKYNGDAYQRGNTKGTSKLERKNTISEEYFKPKKIRGTSYKRKKLTGSL